MVTHLLIRHHFHLSKTKSCFRPKSCFLRRNISCSFKVILTGMFPNPQLIFSSKWIWQEVASRIWLWWLDCHWSADQPEDARTNAPLVHVAPAHHQLSSHSVLTSSTLTDPINSSMKEERACSVPFFSSITCLELERFPVSKTEILTLRNIKRSRSSANLPLTQS